MALSFLEYFHQVLEHISANGNFLCFENTKLKYRVWRQSKIYGKNDNKEPWALFLESRYFVTYRHLDFVSWVQKIQLCVEIQSQNLVVILIS